MTRREAETLQRLLAETPSAGAARRHAHDEGDGELTGLASLARSLGASAAQPTPPFRDALRERVLATADEEPLATRTGVGTVADDLVAAWRYAMRSALPSGALTVLLLVAGLFVGASLSLPGDPLYAIKDAYQQAQLARASAPADVATVKLRMAHTKVEETVQAADRGRLDSLAASAGDANALVRDSAATLLDVYRDSGDSDVLRPLAQFVDDHRTTVATVAERVSGSEADPALARLMSTLERVDTRVDDILASCCQPTGDTAGFWTISSPDASLDQCPCLLDGGSQPGEPQGSGATGLADGLLQLSPRNPGSGDGQGGPGPAQRWRQRLREGVDETRQRVDDATDRVIDTVDDATGRTTDAVDDATDTVTDKVDETTDGVTDTVDGLTGGATEDAAGAVDDTVDGTTDAVDDTTDALDQSLQGVLGGRSGSSDGSAGTNSAPANDQASGSAGQSEEGSGSDDASGSGDASGGSSGEPGSDSGDGDSDSGDGEEPADSGSDGDANDGGGLLPDLTD